jgi:hypothetical protein
MSASRRQMVQSFHGERPLSCADLRVRDCLVKS